MFVPCEVARSLSLTTMSTQAKSWVVGSGIYISWLALNTAPRSGDFFRSFTQLTYHSTSQFIPLLLAQFITRFPFARRTKKPTTAMPGIITSDPQNARNTFAALCRLQNLAFPAGSSFVSTNRIPAKGGTKTFNKCRGKNRQPRSLLITPRMNHILQVLLALLTHEHAARLALVREAKRRAFRLARDRVESLLTLIARSPLDRAPTEARVPWHLRKRDGVPVKIHHAIRTLQRILCIRPRAERVRAAKRSRRRAQLHGGRTSCIQVLRRAAPAQSCRVAISLLRRDFYPSALPRRGRRPGYGLGRHGHGDLGVDARPALHAFDYGVGVVREEGFGEGELRGVELVGAGPHAVFVVFVGLLAEVEVDAFLPVAVGAAVEIADAGWGDVPRGWCWKALSRCWKALSRCWTALSRCWTALSRGRALLRHRLSMRLEQDAPIRVREMAPGTGLVPVLSLRPGRIQTPSQVRNRCNRRPLNPRRKTHHSSCCSSSTPSKSARRIDTPYGYTRTSASRRCHTWDIAYNPIAR